jgi:hypothetical protein
MVDATSNLIAGTKVANPLYVDKGLRQPVPQPV